MEVHVRTLASPALPTRFRPAPHKRDVAGHAVHNDSRLRNKAPIIVNSTGNGGQVVDQEDSFQRKARAIRWAYDDLAVGSDRVSEVRAGLTSCSTETLELVAGLHLLFRGDAPDEIMRDHYLGKRVAAELLQYRFDAQR